MSSEKKFENLSLPYGIESEIKGDTLYVKKWNWDYQQAVDFQYKAHEFIQKNRKLKIYIFCSHPHVFTVGRGNERGVEGLVDFHPSETALKYPCHKIHRGGGVTFHYPGQWIFYPIVDINQKYSLDDHVCWILKSVKNVLQTDFALENVLATKKLVGVWKDRNKLASIGVGMSRFVTLHGLALNLVRDDEMFSALPTINPCGLNPIVYKPVSDYLEDSRDLLERFHKAWITSQA